MKRMVLLSLSLLLLVAPALIAQDGATLDTRIWNQGYWMQMAQQGLVEVNPDITAPPPTYLGPGITPPIVSGGDGPDVGTFGTLTNTTQSENSVFVNPLDNNKVINSNNSTNWPVSVLYGTSNLRTTDGGAAWFGTVDLPGAGTNSGDPAAAIDLNGRYFVGYINNGFGQSVAYSTNEGSSWTNVTITGSGTDDKNHLWVDNSPTSAHEGNLYSAWTSFSTNSDIVISRSTNMGTSWSSPVDISLAVAGGSHDQGVSIQTGPNGEVYAVWAVYDCWPCDETAIGMAKSTDGGATYAPGTRILTGLRGIRQEYPGTFLHRVNSFPVMAVDNSQGPRSGWIYVVWTNHGVPGVNTGNDRDVYMSRSTNGGTSWSTPAKVNQDASGLGKLHYEPWISVDPVTGALSCIFYDNRNTTGSQVEAWVATSIDGGNTWEDFRVSDIAFTPSPIPGLAGGYMGDYLAIASRGGKVYPVWTDNRSGPALSYTSPFQLATNVGWVNGTVTSGGNPVADVAIDFLEGGIQIPGNSDANGLYLAGAEVDTNTGSQNYTIRATKFGYLEYTAPVTLILDDTISHNITLATAPGGTLMIHAHDNNGDGIGAGVSVLLAGEEVVSGNTDPVTGDFTTPLPSGTYDVVVDPPSPYGTETFTGVVVNANQTTNIDALVSYVVDPNPREMHDSLVVGQIHAQNLSLTNTTDEAVPFRISARTTTQMARGKKKPRSAIPPPVPDYPMGSAAPSTGLAPGSKAGSPNQLSSGPGPIAYAVSANLSTFFEELSSFDVAAPGNFHLIASTGDPKYFAGDMGPDGMIYALDYFSNQLVTIDSSNGVVTTIGSSVPTGGETWSGLTYDFSTGTWFAASTDISRSTLYEIDPGTGQSTMIGQMTGSPGCIDISADNTGELFGYDILNDNFYSVDKGTGVITVIGLIGFDANFAQGMDFDPATNDCYMGAYNNATGQGELRTVDITTGNTTLVGAFPGQEVTVMGIPGAAGPQWLSVDPTSGTIPANSSQNVTVTFDANGLKVGTTYFGTLNLTPTHPDVTETIVLPASLTTQLADSATLLLTRVVVEFPVTPVFDTRRDSVLARNGGATTLNISSIASTNPEFVVTPANAILEPLDSVFIRIAYTPTAEGPDTGRVIILSNSQFTPRSDIILSGEAIGVPTFLVRIDSLQMDIEGGVKDSIQFYMRNEGTASGNFVARAIARDPESGARIEFPVQISRATQNLSYPKGSAAPSAGPAPRSAASAKKLNQKSLNELLRGAGTTGYAISANLSSFFEELNSFDVSTPGTFRLIASTGDPKYFSGDFGPDGNLYALDYFANQLVTVDSSNGMVTTIGSSLPFGGETWSGLTYDPTADTWYGASTNISRSTLYEIDGTNGATTVIGEIIGSAGCIDISVDNNGQMYGYDILTDVFYSVDKGSGSTTTIGPIGFDANFAQGMDFDPATNICYMGAYNNSTGQGELRIVDVGTGNAALVGQFPGHEVTVLGISGSYGGTWLSVVPTDGTVAIGDSVLMTARFDATIQEIYENPGNYFGDVVVTASNSTLEDTLSIPVRMFVMPPLGARLIATPNSLNFGDVRINFSDTVSTLIRNIGLTTLNVTNMQTDNGDFVVLPPLSFSLVTNDTARVYVAFNAPFPAGTYGGNMTFTSNDPLAPVIPLTAETFGVPHFADNIDSLQIDIEGGVLDSIQFYMRNDGTASGDFRARAIMFEQTASGRAQPQIIPVKISPATVSKSKTQIARRGIVDGESLTLNKPIAIERTRTNSQSQRSVSGQSGVQVNPEYVPRTHRFSGPGAGNVAVLGADAAGGIYLDNVSQYLIASGEFESVSTLNGNLFTPTLEELQAYDAIGVFGWYGFLDTEATGNVLADYVDAGGNLFIAFAANGLGGTWNIGGRFASQNYWLISAYNYEGGASYSMGTIHEPSHPIMADVNVLNSGSKLLNGATVTDGATLLAEFSDGTPLAAVNEVVGRRVDISFPFFTSTVDFWGIDPSTDAIPLIVNAFQWLVSGGSSWLEIDPTAGTIAIGDSVLMTARFDATTPEIYENPGNYFGNVQVTASNSTLEDTLSIPVRMFVVPPVGARLTVLPSALEFGTIETGTDATLSVRVRNIGQTTLDVTNVTIDDPNFSVVAPTNFSVATFDTHLVYVVFSAPLSAGDFSGTMSFICNDPLAPVVPVSGSAEEISHIDIDVESFSFNLTGTDTVRASMVITNTGTASLDFAINEGLSGMSEALIESQRVRSTQQQPIPEAQEKGHEVDGPGQPALDGTGGPDEFGYIWIDSDEPGGPSFEWDDITGEGTELTAMGDDENRGPFSLGFSFSYYGNNYTSVRITSNGWISFTSTSAEYSNTAIPTVTTPNNAIYGFWDDLYPPDGGTIHYLADVANDRFIVQWTDINHISDIGTYTFQIALYSSGEILVQYLDMVGDVTTSTLGIEDNPGAIGLQVVYNAAYVHNNLALLYTRDLIPWMSAEPTMGTIAAGDSMEVEVRVHPEDLASGHYEGNFIISGNTPDVVIVPVTLDLLVSVANEDLIPTTYGLSQNYPNPFNPETRIKYSLPEQASVSLKIYNLLGQEVLSLASEIQEAGFYEVTWNGHNNQGASVGTGVYFYRFEATGNSGKKFTELKKMIFLK